METASTSIMYEFSTDILETGWIDNVKLYITIDGKTIELSCEFLLRYEKTEFKEKEQFNVFYSKFVYYVSFDFSDDVRFEVQDYNLVDIYVKKSSVCQYFFTYNINETSFKTQPVDFRVVL